ncbi:MULTISPECIES: hypothetical protein [Clostridium]|uniref:hypothetical protein n=1 Tax=Clostridium TaxID=1485 RepID=UPI0006ABDEE3|nr:MULTISPECIES: hypothetical protein [Clostridium]KOR26785.1 hypothetical protein ND00_03120 [Clostridium sp. L74]
MIKYKKKVLNGYLLTKEEVEELLDEDTTELATAANEIRKSLCGNKCDKNTNNLEIPVEKLIEFYEEI